MPSYREMDETGRNPAKVRNLALGLLKLAETTENIFTDRQLTFLRSMVGQAEATLALSPSQRKQMKDSLLPWEARLAMRDFRLTTRQAEVLPKIRDATILHRDIRGISVRNLINRCYEYRLDLSEDDEEFNTGLWKSGVAELRGRDLAQLKRCMATAASSSAHDRAAVPYLP